MDISISSNTNDETAVKVLIDRIKAEEENNKQLTDRLNQSNLILSSLRTAIQAITNPSSLNLDTTSGNAVIEQRRFNYPLSASWRDKVISYLKFKNKAVTNAEIISAILKVEPNLPEAHVSNMVSGIMSSLVKDGIVEAYKPFKMKGSYYINPKWIVNGVLLEEHKPEIKEQTIW